MVPNYAVSDIISQLPDFFQKDFPYILFFLLKNYRRENFDPAHIVNVFKSTVARCIAAAILAFVS